LTNPNDLLSLSNQTDSFSFNGQTYTETYLQSTRTSTLTTPAGRQVVTMLDSLGRMTKQQVSGLNAENFVYDARGRLSSEVFGSGSEQRTTTLTYNSDGFLSGVTDPIGRTISYEYDNVGRLTKKTLPDQRVINYSYDAFGNLVTITPPGKPAHRFTYTPV